MKPFFARLRPCHVPEFQHILNLPDGCGGRFGMLPIRWAWQCFCSLLLANTTNLLGWCSYGLFLFHSVGYIWQPITSQIFLWVVLSGFCLLGSLQKSLKKFLGFKILLFWSKIALNWNVPFFYYLCHSQYKSIWMNLRNFQNVYFLGIGGIGMSEVVQGLELFGSRLRQNALSTHYTTLTRGNFCIFRRKSRPRCCSFYPRKYTGCIHASSTLRASGFSVFS